ncbi:MULTISPECIES: LPS export ABC transporter periplasmic protein LptC [unclassified Janthinobacterium]|uniref:LPS export ABC transporter periplasmic protein LptC n=1 Tax=unclassified Janthinobacterium TaxID=2610881 RepID=UPI001A1C228C|nr:LPS export ABC transporter periplasmic protein LptC [Janthinobacterium sp. CG_23.4]MDH6156152.1 lipopolysaccharide export system protein LptC [Janthinobacterium sp. CG_23.4]
MRKPGGAHRWRMIFTLLGAIIFALGSFWLLAVMNKNAQDISASKHLDEPDYFITNFSMVRMDLTGKPSYIVSGSKLTHYPLDDSSDIDQPFVRKLSPGMPPLNMHAELAHIDQDNTRLQLHRNVVIDRVASAKAQHLRIETEALTVFPDEERMETDVPVDILTGSSRINGVGMRANNATGVVEVHNALRIVLPPKPRPAAAPK